MKWSRHVNNLVTGQHPNQKLQIQSFNLIITTGTPYFLTIIQINYGKIQIAHLTTSRQLVVQFSQYNNLYG